MNERFVALLAYAAEGEQLEILFDGTTWVAQLPVLPRGADHRWAAGEGVTLELALAALERVLGVPKWTG
ncbi:hypothetical protein [Kineosporia sp. NBRC 101731]|uniref:hypothetical protein n=1 Tax=Kineosporia sp. NBRC 101731 TaxID=3032199 RepID=UPI002552A154|nr:hypothetical protein [Kineosporia sp. NBRC 101731]